MNWSNCRGMGMSSRDGKHLKNSKDVNLAKQGQ